MVASVGPTQSPVTNTFQPGIGNNNERVGTPGQEPRTNQVQPREAPSSETQKSAQEERSLARREEETARANNPADDSARAEGARGSLVDIEV